MTIIPRILGITPRAPHPGTSKPGFTIDHAKAFVMTANRRLGLMRNAAETNPLALALAQADSDSAAALLAWLEDGDATALAEAVESIRDNLTAALDGDGATPEPAAPTEPSPAPEAKAKAPARNAADKPDDLYDRAWGEPATKPDTDPLYAKAWGTTSNKKEA
ncbi:hypothetical protein ACPCG0_09690 [Propionibacteriaceae bacterium Y1923]